MNQKLFDILSKKTDELAPDEEVEVTNDYADADVITFTEPKKGKKIPQLYICEKCGRKKTIRFMFVPTPASAGKCPRCKEGSLYSDFVYENMKKEKLQNA